MAATDTLSRPETCAMLLVDFQGGLDAARAIVVANGGGYGMGLAYAREMIHPA